MIEDRVGSAVRRRAVPARQAGAVPSRGLIGWLRSYFLTAGPG